MHDFYARLVAGNSRAAALAATQEMFRRHPQAGFRHPYYWAGWQLVGDWQPIGALSRRRPAPAP
jgi:CHAT domain-containing protein